MRKLETKMKQTIFIKNTPIDEKRIAFIERVVTRLTRRTRNRSSIAMTPYPISNCVTGSNVSGNILKYMFCATGKIGKLMLCLDVKPKDDAELIVLIRSRLSDRAETHLISSMRTELNLETVLKSGDRLVVSIKPLGEKTVIKEAWISFLWVPEVKEAKMKQFSIDELEREGEQLVLGQTILE